MAVAKYLKPAYHRRELSEKSQAYKINEIRLGKRMENHRVRLANFIADNDYLWQFTNEFVNHGTVWKNWREVDKDEFVYLPRQIFYRDNEENKVTLFFANLEKKLDTKLNKGNKGELNTLLSHIFDTRNELAMSNKFFVPYILKFRGFYGRKYETIYDDLMQEGNIALLNAAHIFDHKRGCKFITIAKEYIDQAVERTLIDKGIIHIPVGVHEKILKLEKLVEQSKNGDEKSLKKISKKLGISVEEAIGLLDVAKLKKVISFGTRLTNYNGDETRELGDSIADPKSIDFIHDIILRERVAPLIEKLRNNFDERDCNILIRKMNGETLISIGEDYGLSRERIRQIINEGKEYLTAKFT